MNARCIGPPAPCSGALLGAQWAPVHPTNAAAPARRNRGAIDEPADLGRRTAVVPAPPAPAAKPVTPTGSAPQQHPQSTTDAVASGTSPRFTASLFASVRSPENRVPSLEYPWSIR